MAFNRCAPLPFSKNSLQPAMPMNQIQFLCGVFMPKFFAREGTEAHWAAGLVALRRPQGSVCPLSAPIALRGRPR